MIKLDSFRAALTDGSPWLRRNPEHLHVRIERGEIHSTHAGGLSFEYQFDLVALVTDFADHADTLFLPIVAWLHEAQPDMLQNPARGADFTFEVDVLDGGRFDVEIRLSKLTERVVVSLDDPRATHPPSEDENGTDIEGSHDNGQGQNETGTASTSTVRIPVPAGLIGQGTVATVRHVTEPPVQPHRQVERWRFFVGEELFREFESPPFDGPIT